MSKPDPKLDLKYEWSDNGYCRVMYSITNSKGQKFLYCLQNESSTGLAFVLYRCTIDYEEPEYSLNIKENIRTIDVPEGDSDIDKELREFLTELKLG